MKNNSLPLLLLSIAALIASVAYGWSKYDAAIQSRRIERMAQDGQERYMRAWQETMRRMYPAMPVPTPQQAPP